MNRSSMSDSNKRKHDAISSSSTNHRHRSRSPDRDESYSKRYRRSDYNQDGHDPRNTARPSRNDREYSPDDERRHSRGGNDYYAAREYNDRRERRDDYNDYRTSSRHYKNEQGNDSYSDSKSIKHQQPSERIVEETHVDLNQDSSPLPDLNAMNEETDDAPQQTFSPRRNNRGRGRGGGDYDSNYRGRGSRGRGASRGRGGYNYREYDPEDPGMNDSSHDDQQQSGRGRGNSRGMGRGRGRGGFHRNHYNQHEKVNGVQMKNSQGTPILVLRNDYFENKDIIDKLPVKNTLFVSNLPKEECPDADAILNKLHQHFIKFGELKNILVRFDKLQAYVQFEKSDDGHKAVTSPDAVMNNRFVLVDWCRESQNKRPGLIIPGQKTIPIPEPPPVVIPTNTIATAQAALLEQRQKQEKLKTIAEINKKKEEMLKGQLSNMNQMMEMLAKMPDGEEKARFAARIKTLAQSVDQSLQEQKENVERTKAVSTVVQENQSNNAGSSPPSTTTNGHGHEQGDVDSNKPNVIGSPRGRGRGRGGASLRGRGGKLRGGASMGGAGKLTLDNRTSTVVINNIPAHKKTTEAIKSHFEPLGITIDQISFEEPNFAIIKFSNRAFAERAITQGKMMDGVQLSMQWKNQPRVQKEEEAAAPILEDFDDVKNDYVEMYSDEEDNNNAGDAGGVDLTSDHSWKR
ncbi:hypothetical protein AKO1_010541 [Acrasis kona]|uniref:RRM domain-containing protein n=1 Tax=Acrasis kona TaxID=1008807 RepID=A0AAW2ZJS4_9EUKA